MGTAVAAVTSNNPVRDQWAERLRVAEGDASWRAVVSPDVERTEALGLAVIISTKVGRGRHFEVHVRDRLVAQRTSLEDAKAEAEKLLGPLTWRQERITPEWAVHYWFGPSTEWTEPTTAWVGHRV